MFKKVIVLSLLVFAVFFYGCEAEESKSSQPAPQTVSESGSKTMDTPSKGSLVIPDVDTAGNPVEKGEDIAVLETTKGVIAFRFFKDVAPGTVANFIKLANSGFYNGLTFHRVLDNFMAQGGCPIGNGTGDAGYKIKAEFNARKHLEGTLAMARAQSPDSAGSQFYICLVPTPFLDGKYTVFGQVVTGLDVLHKLQKIDPSRPNPAIKPDKMTKVYIVQK